MNIPTRTRDFTSGLFRMVVALMLAPSLTYAQPTEQVTPDPIVPTFLEAPASADYFVGRRGDVKFWLLGAALGTSMALDTTSTFDVLGRCPHCVETNPYVAPFIARGPGVAFTAGGGFDIGVMAVAAWMRGSPHPVLRKMWWVVPAVLTTGHLMAYRSNLGVAR